MSGDHQAARAATLDLINDGTLTSRSRRAIGEWSQLASELRVLKGRHDIGLAGVK